MIKVRYVVAALAIIVVLLASPGSLARGDGPPGSNPSAAASSLGQGVANPDAPEGWVIECADCKTIGNLTDRSLALDSSGHPHIVYGRDHLYHAYYDGTEWQFETADCRPTAIIYTALALDGNDYAHVSYYDEEKGDLVYAYQDASGWHVETVDSAGDVGQYTSIDVDDDNHPHISYFDATNYLLKAARKDAAGWHIETIDSIQDTNGIGFSTSLALDSSGYAHISYHDGSLSLNHAYQDATGWHVEAGIDYISGHYSSIAVDDQGWPHISHHGFSVGQSDLRYTYKDGSGWHTEIVDSPPGAFDSTGQDTSIALDGSGYPHISYGASTALQFMYAYKDGSGWHLETIEVGSPGTTSLAVDGNGKPHIAYGAGILSYAERNGGGWQTQVLDRSFSVGNFPSLALDTLGGPHISHRQDNGGLNTTDIIRYAYKVDGCWISKEIDTVAFGSDATSLALDSQGYPHIAYSSVDAFSGTPRYAYMDATGWHTETVVVMGAYGRYWENSMALDKSDVPIIAYYHETSEHLDVALAHRDTSGWITETVAMPGRHPSLALDDSNTPHISYWNEPQQLLRYATADVSGWLSETVAGGDGTAAGRASSIALDGSGYPHIAYVLDASLWYAYMDQSGWHHELVQQDLVVHWQNFNNSLALDENGYPHISYHRYTDITQAESNLQYAHKDGDGWHVATLDSSDLPGLNLGQQSSIALDADGHVHIAYYGGGLKYAHQVAIRRVFLPLVFKQ